MIHPGCGTYPLVTCREKWAASDPDPSDLGTDLSEKAALEKTFDSNHDALGGSAPATRASPGCDSAVLPVHNPGEISCTRNTEAS